MWTPGTTVLDVVTQLLGSNAIPAALAAPDQPASDPRISRLAVTSATPRQRRRDRNDICIPPQDGTALPVACSRVALGSSARRFLVECHRSGRTPVRSLARHAQVSGGAACGCAITPGLMLERLVRPGVEDQRLQLGT